MACEHYNQFHFDFDRFADSESDEFFLQRICVNYLRHERSEYDYDLDRIFGKAGAEEAREALRDKIYEAIAEKYDWLSEECKRQVLSRLMGNTLY